MIDRGRVLIIDEDRRVVDKLQELLAEKGYEAEIALSGDVGISIIEEREMSVALLNAKVGHKQDWALVRKLKQSAPRLPVVVFDGPKVKGLSREARKAGVTKFLPSPVDVQTLLDQAIRLTRL